MNKPDSKPKAKPKPKPPLGFAALDPDRRRELASKGGKAAHASGHAHQFDHQEARAAGIKRHQPKSGTGEPQK